MTSVEIKSLDEHVFEFRNKSYGAYQLRKNQNRNLLIGMVAVYGAAALVWGTSQALASFFPEKPQERIIAIFPDPEVNPESEPNIEKREQIQKGKSQNRITGHNEILFRITDTTLLTSPILETATETMEESEVGTGNGTEDGDGNSSSTTGVIGEEEQPETPLIQIVEPALFPGGDKAMEEFIKTEFDFPQTEQAGTLVVYFEIDESGKTKNVKILKSFPGGTPFELEAIRLLSNMPDWSPQKVNGKPVMVRKEIKINCKL